VKCAKSGKFRLPSFSQPCSLQPSGLLGEHIAAAPSARAQAHTTPLDRTTRRVEFKSTPTSDNQKDGQIM
jgi:hypothetical protein